MLIGLAGAGVVSWLFGFEAMGGLVVGTLPEGLPPIALPSGWGYAPDLILGAVLVAIIGLLEVMTVTAGK